MSDDRPKQTKEMMQCDNVIVEQQPGNDDQVMLGVGGMMIMALEGVAE